MHLVSIMYAAFKRIAPDVDGGIDLSEEYETALAMRGTKQRSWTSLKTSPAR